jgi:hypothetical protein
MDGNKTLRLNCPASQVLSSSGLPYRHFKLPISLTKLYLLDSNASSFQVIHISSDEKEALPAARLLKALSVKMDHESEDTTETWYLVLKLD